MRHRLSSVCSCTRIESVAAGDLRAVGRAFNHGSLDPNIHRGSFARLPELAGGGGRTAGFPVHADAADRRRAVSGGGHIARLLGARSTLERRTLALGE